MNSLKLIYSNHNRSSPLTALRNENLKFNNLVFLKNGNIRYEIDEKEINLSSGDVLFVPQGSKRFRDKTEQKIEHFVFNFHTERPVCLPTVMHNGINSAVFSLLAAYEVINENPQHDHREKNEHLLECLLLIMQDYSDSQNYHPLTRRILSHIHSHYSAKITLQDIGVLTFFSPIYCDTVFKTDTGTSIIEYVISLRIEKAKQLLLEDETSIKEIAESVGFHDCNYFSRVFKKRVGLSPSNYRKRF